MSNFVQAALVPSITRGLFVQVPCRCQWAWALAAGPRTRWTGPAK